MASGDINDVEAQRKRQDNALEAHQAESLEESVSAEHLAMVVADVAARDARGRRRRADERASDRTKARRRLLERLATRTSNAETEFREWAALCRDDDPNDLRERRLDEAKLCGDVYGELKSIKDASVADAKKDDDHDGKPDIEQLPPAEQLKRRVRVAALAVRDPTKLSTAAGGLYMGWLAVQGTLRLKFARTVTLGVSIANTLDGIVQRNGVPVLQKYVDPALAHWLPVIVSTMAKMLAVALAWQLQVMISSVQSALRGGLLARRKTLAYLNRTGRVKLAEDDTYLDEMAGFALAACGCYFQWRTGWAPPFPMNIVMLPFTAVEWYVRWSVTS